MMDIYLKLERIDKIRQEIETIHKTLEVIRHLNGTMNVRTTERCLAIARRLADRSDVLYEEFKQLSEEIDKFMEENGL